LLYQALADGKVDLVVASATDGLIAAMDLVVLEDDRHYFPPYDAVPVMNEASLRRHAGLAEAVESLAGRIDEKAMRRMNYLVDGEHRRPADVAREFLAGAGLRSRLQPGDVRSPSLGSRERGTPFLGRNVSDGWENGRGGRNSALWRPNMTVRRLAIERRCPPPRPASSASHTD
jgi:substrate binding protein of glycine betaine ABC transport system